MLFFHPWKISLSPANTERWFRIANAANSVVRIEVVKDGEGTVFVSGYNCWATGINISNFSFTDNTDEQKHRVDAALMKSGHHLCASEADAEKFQMLL